MKKILAVLALLLACGMAFSVTGSVYFRLTQAGTVVDSECNTLDDLSYRGRRGSGVDINFDNFGVSYKLRGPIVLGTRDVHSSGGGETVGLGISSVYTAQVGSLAATSPGYVQFNGIKLGTATLAIGGSWWHFDESQSALSTNALGTNNQVAAGSGAGYNHFAFNSYFSVPVSDTIKIQNVPWDQMQLDFGFGSATVNGLVGSSTAQTIVTNGINPTTGAYNVVTNAATTSVTPTTNTASSSEFRIYLPFYIDITMDKLSLELYPKFVFGNSADSWTMIGVTNAYTTSEAYVSGMVRIGYSINDNWAAYLDIGLVMWNRNNLTTTKSTTNSDANNQLVAPIRGGFTYKPAPWFTLNLGLGYIAQLNSVDTVVNASGATATTNITTSGGGLAGFYNDQDEQEHGYNHPFINFGSSSKFAEDWSIGVTEIVMLNATGAFGGAYYNNNTISGNVSGGFTSTSQIFHFDNVWNFDGGGALCWIQYSKDNFTLKGTFGGASGLLSLFQQIDFSINF